MCCAVCEENAGCLSCFFSPLPICHVVVHADTGWIGVEVLSFLVLVRQLHTFMGVALVLTSDMSWMRAEEIHS